MSQVHGPERCPQRGSLVVSGTRAEQQGEPQGGTWGDGRARPGRPAEWPHLPLELLRFEQGQGGIKQPPSPLLCEAHPGTPRPAAAPGAPARLPSAWMVTRARSHPWSSVHWVPRVASAKRLASGPLLPGGRSSAPEPLGVSVWRMHSVVSTPSKSCLSRALRVPGTHKPTASVSWGGHDRWPCPGQRNQFSHSLEAGSLISRCPRAALPPGLQGRVLPAPPRCPGLHLHPSSLCLLLLTASPSVSLLFLYKDACPQI